MDSPTQPVHDLLEVKLVLYKNTFNHDIIDTPFKLQII